MTSNIAKKTGKTKIDDRVVLNVGGWRFETRLSTLARYPYTRLGELSYTQQMDASWDQTRSEYFFDRNALVFSSILQLYRTGEFHPDHNICGHLMKMELEFWGLSEVDIESCCWGQYSKFKDHKDTLSALDDSFTSLDYHDDENAILTKWQIFRREAWRFLEDPSSSKWAKLFAVTAMFFVFLSIMSFCLETHEWFRVLRNGYFINKTSVLTTQDGRDGAKCCCSRLHDPKYIENSMPHPAMSYIDLVCTCYFTIEYVTRLFFAPKTFGFLIEPLNIIDLVCLIPYYTNFIMSTVDSGVYNSDIFRALLSLRMIRVLRIFKIMKHYTAFKILLYTLKVSTKELLLIIAFLFTGVLIFASVIYYVENPPFTSIPIGFWWALVTMTTVGYGDRVPQSEGGYIVGSVCVLCGVLTIAFTVPIVVNNFTMYYSHAQSRIRLPPEKRSEIKKRIMRKHGGTMNPKRRSKVEPSQGTRAKRRDESINVESETVTISEQKSHVIHTSWTRHKQTTETMNNGGLPRSAPKN